MLTTAACPDASSRRRPSAVTIHAPSPRTAIGNSFLKFLGNRAEGFLMSRGNCSAINTRMSSGVMRMCYACAILRTRFGE